MNEFNEKKLNFITKLRYIIGISLAKSHIQLKKSRRLLWKLMTLNERKYLYTQVNLFVFSSIILYSILPSVIAGITVRGFLHEMTYYEVFMRSMAQFQILIFFRRHIFFYENFIILPIIDIAFIIGL